MQAFLASLRGSGELVLSAETPPPLDESSIAALEEHDALYRLELPLIPPPLDVPTAYWAASTLYSACHLLVQRDAPAQAVRERLGESAVAEGGASPSPSPAVHYAADLTFQYLPSLHRLAERVAREDPLVDALRQLGAAWPLSSVGMPVVSPEPERFGFLDDPCLRQLYVDRIIETKDVSRLSDEHVKRSVRASLGAYPELAPEVAESAATS